MARLNRITRYLNTLTGRMVLGVLAIHALLIPLLFIGVLFITKLGYEDQFVNHVRSDAHLFSRLVSQDIRKERLETLKPILFRFDSYIAVSALRSRLS